MSWVLGPRSKVSSEEVPLLVLGYCGVVQERSGEGRGGGPESKVLIQRTERSLSLENEGKLGVAGVF